MRAFVVAVVVVAVAVGAGTAHAATAPFDPALRVEAQHALNSMLFRSSTTIPKFVYVRCYKTDALFDGAYWWRGGDDNPDNLWAYAIFNEHTIYLRPSLCSNAHKFITRMNNGSTGQATAQEVFGYATFLHEAIHVQGIHDEKTTDCLANDGVRWAARWHGVEKSEANRLSRMAFDAKAKWVAASYRSVSGQCEAQLSTRDWSDYIED